AQTFFSARNEEEEQQKAGQQTAQATQDRKRDRAVDDGNDGNAGFSQAAVEAVVYSGFVQQHYVNVVASIVQAHRVADDDLVSATDWSKEVTLAKSNLHRFNGNSAAKKIRQSRRCETGEVERREECLILRIFVSLRGSSCLLLSLIFCKRGRGIAAARDDALRSPTHARADEQARSAAHAKPVYKCPQHWNTSARIRRLPCDRSRPALPLPQPKNAHSDAATYPSLQ